MAIGKVFELDNHLRPACFGGFNELLNERVVFLTVDSRLLKTEI